MTHYRPPEEIESAKVHLGEAREKLRASKRPLSPPDEPEPVPAPTTQPERALWLRARARARGGTL